MQVLDDDYANGPYIRNADEFVLHWAAAAKEFRVRLFAEGRAKLNISYGPSSRQFFDYYSPKASAQNLLIFVHGGSCGGSSSGASGHDHSGRACA